MRFLEVFGQHTFYYAAEFLEGTVVIKNANDSDGGSYSFEVQDDGDILTAISSSDDVNWFTLNSIQGSDSNDQYRAPAIIFSKTATDVDGQKEGAIFFGSSSVGGSVASIVGWHHDVSDGEGGIQLAVKTETGSGLSTPKTFADWHGSKVHIGTESGFAAGNVIKGYANGAGIVNVDLGIGASSTTTIAGNAYVTSNIELGHASDTTISRSSAGVVQIEGSTIATAANLATLVTDLHGAGVDGSVASIVGWHHDVSDGEGGIQLAVKTETGSGLSTPKTFADWHGSKVHIGTESGFAAGNVIKGYANGAGIVNVDLGIGASSTTTIAGNAYVTSNIELGHASDTTISRSSAGVVQIEGSTIATAANLATLVTDLHGAGVDGAANQLLTDDGDGTVTSESTLTWDASMLTVSSTGDAGEPIIKIHQTQDAVPTTGGELRFDTDRGAGLVGNADDILGTITWRGHDNQTGGSAAETIYASVVGLIQDPNNSLGSEDGKLEFNVLNQNVSNTGLLLSPSGINGHVNATIGKGAVGVVTIEGYLNLGGHNINDIDITSEASDADDHLMTAAAIKNRILDFGYATASSLGISGSANQILTDDGDGTVTSESELTYSASVLQIESSTSERPNVRLVNSNTDANGSAISFQKTATGADDDVIGEVSFIADNDADEVITYAQVSSQIADASDTDEAGKYEIKVACSGV